VESCRTTFGASPITAPIAGEAGNRTLRAGRHVSAGTQLMVLGRSGFDAKPQPIEINSQPTPQHQERIMENSIRSQAAAFLDMKFEVAIIPVSDIDRAKSFYEALGWRLDADFLRSDGSRAVQLTPPGSPSSIQLGSGPSARYYLVVHDINAARADLAGRGADVSEVFHRGDSRDSRISGPDPDRRSYASFVTFNDPDGNNWLVQEVTRRLPGRMNAGTATFSSRADLAAALRRAATAHGEHEARIGRRDTEWCDWYADHIIGEQSGAQPSL
jgi:catechol 2,3-dioxygenase-like lactoylglutathione lyase family enzyme